MGDCSHTDRVLAVTLYEAQGRMVMVCPIFCLTVQEDKKLKQILMIICLQGFNKFTIINVHFLLDYQ